MVTQVRQVDESMPSRDSALSESFSGAYPYCTKLCTNRLSLESSLQVAFAEELVARFLIRPSRELADISRDKSPEPTKEHLISLFNQIEICLSVLAKSLPDVEHPGKPIPGDSLAVHSKVRRIAAYISAHLIETPFV